MSVDFATRLGSAASQPLCRDFRRLCWVSNYPNFVIRFSDPITTAPNPPYVSVQRRNIPTASRVVLLQLLPGLPCNRITETEIRARRSCTGAVSTQTRAHIYRIVFSPRSFIQRSKNLPDVSTDYTSRPSSFRLSDAGAIRYIEEPRTHTPTGEPLLERRFPDFDGAAAV